LKVLRQCPLNLLVEVCLRGSEAYILSQIWKKNIYMHVFALYLYHRICPWLSQRLLLGEHWWIRSLWNVGYKLDITSLISREDSIAYSRRESFKSYIRVTETDNGTEVDEADLLHGPSLCDKSFVSIWSQQQVAMVRKCNKTGKNGNTAALCP
jgi:hypothetical protein